MSSTRSGTFESDKSVTFKDGPPYWKLEANPGTTVLVMYSPSTTSAVKDKAPINDELVVELPTDAIAAGAEVPIDKGRYQRGSAILTFASTTLDGQIEFTDELRGSVSLTATAPTIDTLSAGQTTAEFGFELERK